MTASSTAAGPLPSPASTARSSVISATKSLIAATDRVAMPGASAARSSASAKAIRSREASASTHASARSPIPRRGVLRIRRRLTTSVVFAISRR